VAAAKLSGVFVIRQSLFENVIVSAGSFTPAFVYDTKELEAASELGEKNRNMSTNFSEGNNSDMIKQTNRPKYRRFGLVYQANFNHLHISQFVCLY
jgi:hypothetical protein